MRVAIDARKIDDFGIGTTIRGLVEGLAEIAPDDLEILLLGPASIAERIPDSPLFAHVKADAPHYSLREILEIGRAAEMAGADLLHVPHYVTPRTRLRLVVTIHDLIHLRVPRATLPFGARPYARWMIGRAAKRSDAIVTVTGAVKKEIEQEYPVSRGKITVIHNGAPAVNEPPVPVSEREPFLLFVGNHKPHKNVDRLVDAFETVRQRDPHLSLTLVGSPFERFRSRDGVRCPGFVSDADLRQLYRRATALVQPSLFEGFGLPVAEAMSHGTPVIVSAIPPLLEVAGDAAIPIEDPSSISSITEALVRALESEELRERSSTAGLRQAGMFRWRDAATAYLSLWHGVALPDR